ncbi:MAG TPA: hypothetical protein VG826_03600 [Pirellulales bacterium]|nr:hypothetical protein [Pirellulales bacterium]
MPRPQFTLRALLVAMLVVAAFLGGMAAQARLDRPQIERIRDCAYGPVTEEILITPDGKRWTRSIVGEEGDE